MRVAPLLVLALAAIVPGCSGDEARPPAPVDPCDDATVALIETWYGWPLDKADVVETSCRLDGHPDGPLTITADEGARAVTVEYEDVRSWSAREGSLLGTYLTERFFPSDDSDRRIETRRQMLTRLARHPAGCGPSLSIGQRTALVEALPAHETTTGWLRDSEAFAEVVVARAVFGSGLPGEFCSDLEEETRYPRIDAKWPVRYTSATLTVAPSGWAPCGPATMRLVGAEALPPHGEPVVLGDLLLENDAFGIWPPGECRLSS